MILVIGGGERNTGMINSDKQGVDMSHMTMERENRKQDKK
jgi:hypothetical protein